MRKKLFNILCLFIFMFSLTGCVKYNASMDIHKDKSMDFTIVYALDTSIFGYQSVMENSDIEKLTSQGFKVSEYVDGNMKGYSISKSYKNIDSVSSNSDVVYSLSNFMEENADKIFTVKKGFLKNTYIANFKFDASDSDLSGDSDKADDYTIYNDAEDDLDFSDDTDLDLFDDKADDMDILGESEDDMDILDNDLDDLSNYAANMDLSFSVKLPDGAKSNNATNVSDDSKQLTWVLTSDGGANISFEFELVNYTNLYIAGGAVLALIILVVIIIVVSRGKKGKNDVSSYNDALDNSNSVQQDIQSNVSNLETLSNGEFLGVQQSNLVNNDSLNTTIVDTNSQQNNVEVLNSNLDSNVQQPVNSEVHSEMDNSVDVQSVFNVQSELNNNVGVQSELNNNVGVQSGLNNSIESNIQQQSVDIQKLVPEFSDSVSQNMNVQESLNSNVQGGMPQESNQNANPNIFDSPVIEPVTNVQQDNSNVNVQPNDLSNTNGSNPNNI